MSSGTLPRNSGFFTAADTASSCARFFSPAMNSMSTPAAS